jgi:integrase
MARLKQRSDGYYRAWYKGKQFLGKTQAEAEAKRNAYQYECEHGIEQQKPITVFELAEQWLPVAKAGASKNTYNQYATIMEKMTGIIGNKLVSAVTPNDIKKIWVSYVGLSQSYISKASFLYKAFFQSAIENGYCRMNPVISPSAKPHKGSKGTHRALTKEEITLIETVPHRMQPAAMFMLKAGLRRGEVLALTKKDIHNDRIYITKAVRFVNNRPVIDKTKNESSERTVPLFAPLKPFIKHVDRYIIPDAEGNLCSEMAFKRAWESYLHTLSVAAGHEISFRPHDLRHTFVTACRDKGIDLHICMDWCGHASERMILEIYDHPSEQRELSAIELMEA